MNIFRSVDHRNELSMLINTEVQMECSEVGCRACPNFRLHQRTSTRAFSGIPFGREERKALWQMASPAEFRPQAAGFLLNKTTQKGNDLNLVLFHFPGNHHQSGKPARTASVLTQGTIHKWSPQNCEDFGSLFTFQHLGLIYEAYKVIINKRCLHHIYLCSLLLQIRV